MYGSTPVPRGSLSLVGILGLIVHDLADEVVDVFRALSLALGSECARCLAHACGNTRATPRPTVGTIRACTSRRNSCRAIRPSTAKSNLSESEKLPPEGRCRKRTPDTQNPRPGGIGSGVAIRVRHARQDAVCWGGQQGGNPIPSHLVRIFLRPNACRLDERQVQGKGRSSLYPHN